MEYANGQPPARVPSPRCTGPACGRSPVQAPTGQRAGRVVRHRSQGRAARSAAQARPSAGAPSRSEPKGSLPAKLTLAFQALWLAALQAYGGRSKTSPPERLTHDRRLDVAAQEPLLAASRARRDQRAAAGRDRASASDSPPARLFVARPASPADRLARSGLQLPGDDGRGSPRQPLGGSVRLELRRGRHPHRVEHVYIS